MVRIRFKPNRKLARLLKLAYPGPRQEIVDVMQRAENDIKTFWTQHIYDYFDARVKLGYSNTGQLGTSLRIKTVGNLMQMSMIPLHNARTKRIIMDFPRMKMFSGNMTFVPFSMPSFGMGRQVDTDYGELLRKGFKGSPGGYNPARDCRTTYGYHPGYNSNTRWVPWHKYFVTNAKQMLADEMMKSLQKAGWTLIKPWRVDIEI